MLHDNHWPSAVNLFPRGDVANRRLKIIAQRHGYFPPIPDYIRPPHTCRCRQRRFEASSAKVAYNTKGNKHFIPLRNHPMATSPTERASFAEEALRLSGKSEEEIRRMGAMDKAD